MQNRIMIILCFLPQLIYGQDTQIKENNSGNPKIHFEQGLSWQQIIEKSKKENKYIFIDCYATWCVPCKKMDSEVYSKAQVGDFMNAHFVSVKVQMDTSDTDNESVKNWYSDAHELQNKYKVSVFPTYLFFSPEGRIVHRYLSALPDSLFLKIASNALKADKQYYRLLENYLNGKKDYDNLKYLAEISRRIGEDNLANRIATDYLHNYLNTLSGEELYQKKYFDFISTFSSILSSQDRIFNSMYKQSNRVDLLMDDKRFSERLLYYVITKEEIEPKIWPGKKSISETPDWGTLTQSIAQKYNSYYADLVVLDAQLRWYTQKKDRPNQIRYNVKKIDNYGLDTAGIGWAVINNIAFNLVFKHCNNKDTLNKAIRWMEIITKGHPDDAISIDTYANLLYKVGRRDDAIYWEGKAAKIEEEAATKQKREPDKTFQETVEKMTKGIPTWQVNLTM